MRYFLLFILLSLNSYAGNDEPHPIIDSDYVSKYLYNTKDLSTSNLIEIKELLKKNLQRNGNSKIKTQEEMDKELLNALLKYDDIRIKITYVIDELIEEYKVSKEIKETLLSFKNTFKE